MNRWTWIVVVLLVAAVLVVLVRYLMPAPVKVAGPEAMSTLAAAAPAPVGAKLATAARTG